jgi:hypothetical protein
MRSVSRERRQTTPFRTLAVTRENSKSCHLEPEIDDIATYWTVTATLVEQSTANGLQFMSNVFGL